MVVMELQPSEPPGNAKRKLRGYVSEIARLRAEGYTIKSIHQALLKAGVNVAWATVQREAARLGRLGQLQPKAIVREASSISATSSAAIKQQAKPLGNSKKATADEIDSHFASHNSNPLFKKKATKS